MKILFKILIVFPCLLALLFFEIIYWGDPLNLRPILLNSISSLARIGENSRAQKYSDYFYKYLQGKTLSYQNTILPPKDNGVTIYEIQTISPDTAILAGNDGFSLVNRPQYEFNLKENVGFGYVIRVLEKGWAITAPCSRLTCSEDLSPR